MIYMSTTDSIANHKILQHGKIAWVEIKHYYFDSAMDFAVNELRDKAEDAGYNAVIGIHYSVRENEEGIFVTLMGTLVNVE